MSWTLFRFIAAQLLRILIPVWVLAVVVWLIADFGDRLRIYSGHPTSDVLTLYWNKGLVAIHQLGPAVLLMSASLFAARFRQRNEWTALQAAGGSRRHVLLPVAVVGLVAAGLLAVYDELVVVNAGTKVDVLMVEKFQRFGDFRFHYYAKRWFRVGRTLFFVRGGWAESSLQDVSVLKLRDDFSIEQRIDVGTLSSLGGSKWKLADVVERTFENETSSTVRKVAEDIVDFEGTTPETFRVQPGRPELMRLEDISSQIEIRSKVGLPVQQFHWAYHSRWAYPLTGWAAALVALLTGLKQSRRKSLTNALFDSAIIVVGAFVALLLSRGMVSAGHVDASVAAWWAPIVLLVVSAVLWLLEENASLRKALA